MAKSVRRNSIIKKLTTFLSIVLALECLLFTGFILFGGTLDRLDQNAMDILNERTQNRKNYLENEMVQRWSNLEQIQADVSATVSAFLAETGLSYHELVPEDPKTIQMLEKMADPLISLMRRNTVTGAFLILDGGQDGQSPPVGERVFMAGLHIRDLEPTSNPSDQSDLLLERGSSELVRMLNIPMDINWSPAFTISAKDDCYYQPLLAARQEGVTSVADMGYWSGVFTLDGDEVPIITYSQPLLDADGEPYGVVGVELTVDYLRSLLPYSELHADKTAAYLLAVSEDGGDSGTYEEVVTSGPMLRRVFGNIHTYQFDCDPVYRNIYRVSPGSSRAKGDVYASIQPFKLYNSNTIFSGQQWVLISLVEKSELLAFSYTVSSGVLGLALGCLVLGTLLSVLAGAFFTRPIRNLAETVQKLDPSQPVCLLSTNIKEIDDLSSSIESLSANVAETSSRLSKIIEIAGIPLAAFQLDEDAPRPYYTKDFFPLIGREEPVDGVTLQSFKDLLRELEQYIDEGSPQTPTVLYKLPNGTIGSRWLRLQTVRSENSILGVLQDVTDEVLEKRRIEYERDYDLLTNLLNRRSFHTRLARLETHPEEIKIGAMLMMDLDNLKYLNDTYGHDCGDEYIRCAADVLRDFTECGGVPSRISGDEFYLFLSGCENKAQVLRLIDLFKERMAAAKIFLPNGQFHKLRASVGIAWYPDDSTSLSELLRYADFAMYEAKNAIKGSVRNFDIHTYERDSYLLYSREELNRILEERAVDYAFQPIVDAHTGALLGYEALMRPRSVSLPTPLEFLQIARAQSKLLQVERLTWFGAMESFASLPTKDVDTLIFINSISSQALTQEDLQRFDRRFGAYLDRIVLELTEGDELSADATDAKKRRAQEIGMRIAMDDYGAGYSNDSVLLDVSPDFVKVDMAIVRGIHKDKNRQTLFHSITTLCHEMEIKVIAEGVETEEELRAVILMEADYIQGYFTGKPSARPGSMEPAVLEAIRTAQPMGR